MKNISKIFLILFFLSTSANSEDNLKNIKSQLDRLGKDLSDLQLHVYNSSESNFSSVTLPTTLLNEEITLELILFLTFVSFPTVL